MFLLKALNAQDLLNATDYATDRRSYTCGVNVARFDAPTGTLDFISKSAGSSNAWTQRIKIVDIDLLVDYDDVPEEEEYDDLYVEEAEDEIEEEEEDPYEESLEEEDEEGVSVTPASLRRKALSQYSGDESAWLNFKNEYPDVVLSDIRVGCSCPAFQYWGSAYIVDQLDSGDKIAPRYDGGAYPEGRFPSVRDPDLEHTICKHLAAAIRKFFT